MSETEPATPVDVGDDIIVPPKNPFASTTWWGSLTAIVAFVFVWLVRTHKLPAEIEQPVRDLSLDVIAGIVAGVVAMYGRWKATRPLGIGGPMRTTVK
jgi:hypothetical protein